MFRLLLCFLPAALFAAPARYARLGEMDGKVEVQLHAADPWSPAERNLTVTGDAWLRTGAASRLEIELDEGSALRLAPDSMVELSDYTRLSTGQRITLISLDRGVAYFTGEPAGNDALSLAVPGAQIILQRGARVRIEAGDSFSRVTVIEGVVKLSCPAAELDVNEGQTVRVEQGNSGSFALDRGVAPLELDRWSEERDKLLAAPASSAHLALRYGLADLDAAGDWLMSDAGAVWKPKTADGWIPFQKGRWRWYDTLGYTWVSDESWGWLPYHYGRWTRKNGLGWVWVPPSDSTFKPGDVYWLYGRQFAGWGPLAPGEGWTPSVAPQQFSNANTTYATFVTDARVIDPAGFSARPKEPLGAAGFVLALPSPALLPSRLEAKRPRLRVGATRAVAPVVPGTALEADPLAPPPDVAPPAVVTNPDSDAPPVVQPGGVPPPVMYPVPVYTGVVVINPPEHPDYSRRNPNNGPPPRPAPQPAPPPAVRGGSSSGNGQQPTPPPVRPSQPANQNPPPAPVQIPPRMEPPRVGAPAPQRTDHPRTDAPPPRVEQPRPSAPPAPPRQEAAPKPDAPKPEAPKPSATKPDPGSDRATRKQ